MRILLINPNVTEAITERMAGEARRGAAAGTEIVPVTARFGTLYVENRVEATIAGHAVLDALAEHADGCDAAIVCAFGDPGLAAAKELMAVPVVGISETALLTAWMLGGRFSIVCLTARLGRWYEECVADHGLAGRLAAVRPLAGPVPDITRVPEDLCEPLVDLCLRTVEEDGAEVVILGGGPIAGLAREAAHRVPVPLLDGITCAVGEAERLVALAPRSPTRGSFAQPPAKPSKGLSPALRAVVERNGAG